MTLHFAYRQLDDWHLASVRADAYGVLEAIGNFLIGPSVHLPLFSSPIIIITLTSV